MSNTYLTTEGLAERIHYDVRTIRDRLKDSVLIEGKHYFRPFGGRKILFIWETIERDMQGPQLDIDSSTIPVGERASEPAEETEKESIAPEEPKGIPMASGGICNG